MGIWGARWGLSTGQTTILSGNYRPAKIDLENFRSGIFGQKWRFFSIFQKCTLNVIYWYFIVSGHFPDPKWPISGHIWHLRPLPDKIWKIRKKWIFWWFWQFWQNWPIFVVAGVAGSDRGYYLWSETCSPGSLDTFSYLNRWYISSRSKHMTIWISRIFPIFIHFHTFC